MRKMAEAPAFFLSQCSTLLGRMINTVPKQVALTGIIEPIPVKPKHIALMFSPENGIAASGFVRVSMRDAERDTHESTGPNIAAASGDRGICSHKEPLPPPPVQSRRS